MTLGVASVLFVWTGCDGYGYDKGPVDTFDTAVDTGGDTICVNTLWLGFVYDQVIAYCGTGTGPSIPPGMVSIVPHWAFYFPEFPDGNLSWHDSMTDEWQIVVHNSNVQSPLLNNMPYDGDIWENHYDPPCTDYTWTGGNFLIDDNSPQLVWSSWGMPTCGVSTTPSFYQPPNQVLSGSQSCTPGEAIFDLAARGVVSSDGVTSAVWTAPLERTATSFPERAWLRELEVVSWGAANRLNLGEFSKTLGGVDGHFLGGTNIDRPAQGSTIRNYNAGSFPMSTMLGVQGPLTGAAGEMPVVRMRWSCESNPNNPHGMAVNGYTPHVTSMLAGYPIQQRMVFWVGADNTTMRLAPEGRYPDYVQSALTPAAGGGWTFSFRLDSYDATFTGRLVPFGNSYKVLNGVVTMGTTPTSLPIKTLARL